MPFPKTVTAQDFRKAIEFDAMEEVDEENTLNAFDAILSQVRQEARAEGRREGLKEMDDVSNQLEAARIWPPENEIELERLKELEKRRLELRQEYQQPA